MKMQTVKEIRKNLIDYFGKEWWLNTLKWLKENFDYPETHSIPEYMLSDYHPVFRDKIVSVFKITNEESSTRQLIAYSRKDDLKNMRVSLLPQYIGILCPIFRSRSVGNFGLVNMKTEANDIFSRAFYNLPFPFDQKVKRTVISCYGISKHGKNIDNLELYPKGGVFLLNPDKDEEYESFAKYTDYKYVTLNWRFPKNYDEFIKTIDGSVLISKSAAEKLKYKRIAKVIIRNPHPNISNKIFGFIKKDIPKEGSYIEFQEPLTEVGDESIRLSPISGYITNATLLNPGVKESKRWIWELTIEEDRDVEIGCKLESPNGLKHTVADYVDDKDPVIVINPDTFKDRAIWREVIETGKIHCYPTIPGKDGNISNKNVRISRTFIQGLFCYPEKIRNQIIDQIFTRKNLSFPFPENILDILEKLHKVDPDKLAKKYPVFQNYFTYIRKKEVGGKIYMYEEPTKIYRALKKLNQVKDFNKLSKFDKDAINTFVNNIVRKLLLFDSEKKCQIKLNGFIRIILYDSFKNVNQIKISKSLYEKLGKPEYVLFAKEPVTRNLSIRCLEVKVDKHLPDWCIRIHPYLAMDFETEEFHTKIDTDGDLGIIIPLQEKVKGAMYDFGTFNIGNKKDFTSIWFDIMHTIASKSGIKDIKHFKPDWKDISEYLIDIYEYNRRESIEQLCVQMFGGIKNRAMFTDLIKDLDTWRRIVEEFDIELQLFQGEKLNPELKDAPTSKKIEFVVSLLKKAQGYQLPPYHPDYIEYKELESVTYENINIVKKTLKKLKKSDHPILNLMYKIYKELNII